MKLPDHIFGIHVRKLGAMAGAFVVFAVLALAVADTVPWQASGPAVNDTQNGTAPADANDLDGLVAALFDDHVIALEVLGILLTAAMIGALVIARPLGVPDDSTHYEAADTDAPDSDQANAAAAAPILASSQDEEEE